MKTNLIKRILTSATLLLLLLPSSQSMAGGPAFKELQKLKLPFKPTINFYNHTDDFKNFLCSTKGDMLMFDGTSGKILWTINFKNDFANEKFSNQYWNKNANVILVFDEDTKKGIAEKYFIDGKTGKLLWKSSKYVSDFGKYELSEGFQNNFDSETFGVILPTKESVDFVDVYTGNILWSKSFEMSGKAKQFDCYNMNYYDLVRIVLGKDEEMYLTAREGKEVTDIEPYFNKKKYLTDRKHATTINIPEKNMYVIMQGETSKGWSFLGAMQGMSADIPSYKMNFIAYDEDSNKELWRKQHKISFLFDAIDFSPYVRLDYADGKLIVQHDPIIKMNDGLTVLDINTGEKLWHASYSSLEMKSSMSKTYFTPFPSPSPVIVNGNTFVVDKLRNTVRCYNSQTGSLIWESKKYPDAQKIPTLAVTDDMVIMAHGSPAMKVVRYEEKSGTSTRIRWRREYLNKDKYGLIAYDAKTGNIVWDGDQIGKKAKDKFQYVAGVEFIDGKLYCATDKNFFILDPKTGEVIKNIPVSKEKLGNIWKLMYFPEKQKLVLNCANGIIKINALTASIEGSLKTPNIIYYPAHLDMNYDDPYLDYSIFTAGDPKKLKFKTFASIDLDNMQIRGTDEAWLLFADTPHFSQGAELFFKPDGSEVKIYSVK